MLRRCAGGFTTNFKKWSRFVAFTSFVAVIFIPVALPILSWAVEIDPELEEQFTTSEKAGYVVYFRAKANLSGAPKTDWKEQSEFINKALQENANRSQARVRSYLFDRRIPYRSVWKDNTIVVDRSNKDVYDGLKSFPEIESIKSIKPDSKESRKAQPIEVTGSAPEANKP